MVQWKLGITGGHEWSSVTQGTGVLGTIYVSAQILAAPPVPWALSNCSILARPQAKPGVASILRLLPVYHSFIQRLN